VPRQIGARRKNQILLIEILERAGLTDRVHLTLAGTAPDGKGRTEHRQDVADAARRDWVTLVPPKPFREMPALFRDADICILPSFAEPLGVAPVEAMAYGTLPMISAEAGSAGYLQGTEAGHIIDMTRPETLMAPLTALLDDPALLAPGQARAAALADRPLGEARFICDLNALLVRHGIAA
jgi:Glycosyltransferase